MVHKRHPVSANRIAVFRGLVHVLVLQSYSHIKFSLQFSFLLFSCPSAVFFFSVCFKLTLATRRDFGVKTKERISYQPQKAGEMITARKIVFNTCSVPYLCLKTEMNSVNLSFKLCWL